MHAPTYKDLIDEKIREWQQALGKLEEQQRKNRMLESVEQLKPAIDTAITQLSALVKQESIENTMKTKESILEIFTSIDKKFAESQRKIPFML